jgi:hypothetical protein
MATDNEKTPARRIEDRLPDAEIQWDKPGAPAVARSSTASAAEGGHGEQESAILPPLTAPAPMADELRTALELAKRVTGTIYVDSTPGYYAAMNKVFAFVETELAQAALAPQQSEGLSDDHISDFEMRVMHEFLQWNRAQKNPPVEVVKEYAVARKVLQLARAAPAAPSVPTDDWASRPLVGPEGNCGWAEPFEHFARCRHQAAPVQTAELKALQEENDKLRAALGDSALAATMLHELSVEDGGINAVYSGGAAQLLAEALGQQFTESGAENYLEVGFNTKTGVRLLVTLQRCDGKTPATFRREAEEKLAEAMAEIERLRVAAPVQAEQAQAEPADVRVIELDHGKQLRKYIQDNWHGWELHDKHGEVRLLNMYESGFVDAAIRATQSSIAAPAVPAQAEQVAAVRAALEMARSYIDAMSTEPGYGFARPANPHDFHPDAESCSAEEIAAHKAACEAYDKGEYTPERGSEWIGATHILRAPWGIGTYTMRDEQAVKVLAAIDGALATKEAAAPVQAVKEQIRNQALEEAAEKLEAMNDSSGDAAAYDQREQNIYESEREHAISDCVKTIRALRTTSTSEASKGESK